MAKKNDETAGATEAPASAEAPAAAAAPTSDNRHIMVRDPATGEQTKRVDWIRKVYADPNGEYYGNRGKIAKKLSELQGKKIPYQIVFAATKDMKSIPTARKQAEAAAAAAGSTPQA